MNKYFLEAQLNKSESGIESGLNIKWTRISLFHAPDVWLYVQLFCEMTYVAEMCDVVCPYFRWYRGTFHVLFISGSRPTLQIH